MGAGRAPDAIERRRIKARPVSAPRMSDVARMLMGGKSNRELASSLDMASDTVKWHLKNIFSKLGVENRTQAVLRLREMDFS